VFSKQDAIVQKLRLALVERGAMAVLGDGLITNHLMRQSKSCGRGRTARVSHR